MTLIPIEHWIVKNQPEQENKYYTGWWDSMEFVRRLSEDFSSFHFEVIDTFVMDTPPPTVHLKMPVLRGKSDYFDVIFKESWVVEPDWMVSIERKERGQIELYGFIENIDENSRWLLKGMNKEYLYRSYEDDLLKFSGSVRNKYLLYGLFQILESYGKNNA